MTKMAVAQILTIFIPVAFVILVVTKIRLGWHNKGKKNGQMGVDNSWAQPQ